ncbi:MAG: hypothetical protein K9I47_10525 [Bacteroidales bacterium]|nr:hypothetical protein [Bacteroidales bacterium]
MKKFLPIILIFMIGYSGIFSSGNGLLAQSLKSEIENPETFHLVFYGKNLNTEDVKVQLKTNPIAGEAWTNILKDKKIWMSESRKLLVIENLSMENYFGQDIRENYIAVRLTSKAEDSHPEISAMYALPPKVEINKSSHDWFIERLKTQPVKLREQVLASHVRPRPYTLPNGVPFTEHIEAPVRQFKPGVREVEWLELLFQQK